MEKVRLGVIGYGCRSYGMTDIFLGFDDVDVVAVCDKYEDRVENAKNRVNEKRGFVPFGTTNYHEILNRSDIDAVFIATDWEMHIPIAIDAMKAGKAVAMEVGGAYNLKECFDLVDTWEKTKAPFMFLENCCYNRDELLATAIVRTGKLGKIVHCSGAYSHDLRTEVIYGKENRHYRLRNYLNRNCENYPTHELGPMAKVLGINRGNRMVSLVSVASKSFGMEQYVLDHKDKVDPALQGVDFAQGDIVNTVITCENGETMLLTLDTSLPRSYNRAFTVRGTKGMYEQYTNSIFLDGDNEYWTGKEYIEKNLDNAESYKDLLPDSWKSITKEQLDAGHGGMDYVELREFVDNLKSGKEMAIDVYDAAAWMCVTCLSEESIKQGGARMEIPDFTKGAYKTRELQDVVPLATIEEK
jgi:predicted dehydrogenase